MSGISSTFPRFFFRKIFHLFQKLHSRIFRVLLSGIPPPNVHTWDRGILQNRTNLLGCPWKSESERNISKSASITRNWARNLVVCGERACEGRWFHSCQYIGWSANNKKPLLSIFRCNIENWNLYTYIFFHQKWLLCVACWNPVVINMEIEVFYMLIQNYKLNMSQRVHIFDKTCQHRRS